MTLKMLVLSVFFSIPIIVNAEYFKAERVAIDIGIPEIAINRLLPFKFSPGIKGAECNLLLAKAYLIQKNLKKMQNHLQFATKSYKNAYLYTLKNWYVDDCLSLIPLMFDVQNHLWGRFLAKSLKVFFEPINSPKFEAFFTANEACFYNDDYENMRKLICNMKCKISKRLDYISDDTDWKISVSIFMQKEDWDGLKNFLKRKFKDITSKSEKTKCLILMLKTAHKLNEDVDDLIVDYVQIWQNDFQSLHKIFSEWLKISQGNPQKRVNSLNKFSEIYKMRHWDFHEQYVKLLEVDALINVNDVAGANKILRNKLSAIDISLKTFAYELAAKIEFLNSNYEAVVSFLELAKKNTSDISKIFFYTKFQAACFDIIDKHVAAYDLYKKIILKFVKYPESTNLAYEWCVCGILCGKSESEIEKQIKLCSDNNLLSKKSIDLIRINFAKYAFDNRCYSTSYKYLQAKTFYDDNLKQHANFICIRCLINQGLYDKAKEKLDSINYENLSYAILAEYYVCQSYVYEGLNDFPKAQSYLDKLKQFSNVINENLLYEAMSQQVNIYVKQNLLTLAINELLKFAYENNNDYGRYSEFLAACYAEQNGEIWKKKSVEIFENIYTKNPNSILGKDARIKQAIIVMDVDNKSAVSILSKLLPALHGEQKLWCEYLIQKCLILSQKQSKDVTVLQLNSLLKNEMTYALRFEISMQLALLYKDLGRIDKMVECLWNACYQFLDKKNQNLSNNDIYWLNRCLLMLVCNVDDKNLSDKVKKLIIKLKLPGCSIVQ